MSESKTNFRSRIGAVLAAAGSAVGLGNIWRFPTETGTNGGAAFILIYIFFMIVLGVPVMISELTIGRFGQKNVSHSFYAMSGNKRLWASMGWLPVVSGVIVLSYYAVVAGWILEYAYQALSNGFAGKTPEQFTTDFASFSSDPFQPLLWLALIIAMTVAIVACGVRSGIERASKIMMPILFLCIVFLVGVASTLPGASRGLEFLLSPDFSKVTGDTVLSAMGQAFFSLSVGICCLCTYGCYFRKDVNLMKDSLTVALIDTFVALMAGFIIFPAVFSVSGLVPDAGPSLVFITLPNVFQQVFSGIPLFGYFFSLLFYMLLIVAALTSSISMLEMSAAIFIRKYKMGRPMACILVGVVCFVFGTCCSLSFGEWKDITIGGLCLFDVFDFVAAKLLMPLGALVICLFLGWVVDEKLLRNEITNEGTIRQPLYPLFRLCIRYIAPILITLIFANELKLF